MAKLVTTIKVPEQDVQFVIEELKTTPEGQAIHWSGGNQSTWDLLFINTEDMNKFKTMFPDIPYTIVAS